MPNEVETQIDACAHRVGRAIADWNVDIINTIADNASCGGFVVGEAGTLGPMRPLVPGLYRLERDGFAPLSLEAAA